MASRRAAFAPLSVFRTSVDFDFVSDSSSLHAGHRLANPGFPGFNSNSSEQTAQTLIGNPMQILCYNSPAPCDSALGRLRPPVEQKAQVGCRVVDHASPQAPSNQQNRRKDESANADRDEAFDPQVEMMSAKNQRCRQRCPHQTNVERSC